MNDTQMSFADMLGIDIDFGTNEKTKPAASKKVESKKAKKSAQKKGTKAASYKLPVTLYTGYNEPVVIDKDKAGKEKITVEDIKKFAHGLFFTELDIKNMSCVMSKDGKSAYLDISSSKAVQKGTVTVKADSKVFLPGMSAAPSLDSLMDGEKSMVEISQIEELLSSAVNPVFGMGISIIPDKDNLFISFGKSKELSSDEILEFPLNVEVFGREPLTISKEDFSKFVREHGNDVEDVKYDYEMLVNYIVNIYPDFAEGHLSLQYDKDTKLLNAVMKVKEITTASKKETLYPVDGTVMSFFLHNRVTLSPDMFGGQTEVNEDALIEYAHSLYPEFAKGRTYIVYSKEDNMIMPVLKGSTKGSMMRTLDIVTDDVELEKRLKSENYIPFLYCNNGNTYRVENTPVSCTIASIDGNNNIGKYEYKLPKISGKIFDQMDAFFRNVAEVCGTEVLIRFFWNTEKNEYEITLPKQEVSAASVDELSMDRDCRLSRPECYAVGEFHSHCNYNAFFSNVDNADEKGNKFFGVLGKYDAPEGSQLIMRAGTGGYYVTIAKEDIFTDEHATQQEIDTFVEQMMEMFDENVDIL